MRVIFSFLFIVICQCSCIRKNSDDNMTFDSTYYFMLNKAYTAKDTNLIKLFFDTWHTESLKISSVEYKDKDTITKAIYEIFNITYHPFDHTKYNWKYDLPPSQYVILPNRIVYQITDTSFTKILKSDTLNNFYPNPDINGAKKIVNIDPFKKSLDCFLSSDKENKMLFLRGDHFIKLPFRNKTYLTPPLIEVIKINQEITKAIVQISVISSGIEIYLECINGEWLVTEVKLAWIE